MYYLQGKKKKKKHWFCINSLLQFHEELVCSSIGVTFCPALGQGNSTAVTPHDSAETESQNSGHKPVGRFN